MRYFRVFHGALERLGLAWFGHLCRCSLFLSCFLRSVGRDLVGKLSTCPFPVLTLLCLVDEAFGGSNSFDGYAGSRSIERA